MLARATVIARAAALMQPALLDVCLATDLISSYDERQSRTVCSLPLCTPSGSDFIFTALQVYVLLSSLVIVSCYRLLLSSLVTVYSYGHQLAGGANNA